MGGSKFRWVRFHGDEWEIARVCGDYFYLTGDGYEFKMNTKYAEMGDWIECPYGGQG